MHITKILTEIQEHSATSLPSVSMPTKLTRYGFPVVHELDRETASGQPPKLVSSSIRPPSGVGAGEEGRRERKSLFARQFESHNLEYFGVEHQQPDILARCSGMVERDRVEPVATISPRVRQSEVLSEGGRTLQQDQPKVRVSGATAARPGSQSEYMSGTHLLESTAPHPSCKEPAAKEGFLSEASQTWEQGSQLISGEGLVTVGVSQEAAQEEVVKIHRENIERLSGVSAEEVVQERERIAEVLGPSLVSFLRSRGGRGREGDIAATAAPTVVRGGKEREEEEEGGASMEEEGENSQVGPGWLHMDTVEKEKMEWMTDVQIHPRTNEV